MAQKHVLICNERILFRYGVDRILVELAKKFVAEGWRVTFVCLRSDEKLIRAIDAHVLVPPTTDGDIYGLERSCAQFLRDAWETIGKAAPVSLIVSGGWPFFCAAHVGDALGVPSLFIDAGAVPHDGLDDNGAAPQRAVRRLRSLALPSFDRVLPISRFVSESQTIPDRASAEGVNVVPLGVDHFAAFGEGRGPLPDAAEDALLARLRKLAADGAKLVLNLGRFEAVGYKNSQASFALLRELQARARGAKQKDDVRLLLLADETEANTPADLALAVICLGKPSDEAMARIMAIADVGFSPSLWEGFNLPIGEMAILGKPVFAFNIGAHPETIFHPWFLCSGISEAAAKIERTLSGAAPQGLMAPARVKAFRDKFAWARALSAYHAIAEEMVARSKEPRPADRLLLVDVTNASRDTANSGVIRVTRRLSAELRRGEAATLLFVYWDTEQRAYRFVSGVRENLLAGYSGPVTGFARLFLGDREPTPDDMLNCAPGRVSREATLLMAEFIFDGDAGARVDWAKRHGLKTAAILYDLIPIDYPHLCGPDVRAQAPAYLEALSRIDSVIAISAYSLGRFEAYLGDRGLPLPPHRCAIWLPGQLGATQRVRTPQPEAASRAISILCVSTIEPRKNHRALIGAYEEVRRAFPALDLRLTLIGNSYHGAEALAEEVRAAVERDATIEWRRAVSDEELTEAARNASFTVYPSLVEGFGLPILESLWLGKPCICHNDGVMAELAAGGGCITADMNDPAALAQAIKSLAVNRSLRDRLGAEARARDIDAWPDYARHFGQALGIGPKPAAANASSAALAATRKRIAQDSYFLDHRLRGVGLISGLAIQPPAPQQEPPPAIAPPPPAPPPAPAAAEPRPAARKRGLFSLFGRRALTAREVRESGLFDEAWYLEAYPDIREAGVDPADHFARFGHREERSPGPNFDPNRYRRERPEMDATGLSAFEHYLRRGR